MQALRLTVAPPEKKAVLREMLDDYLIELAGLEEMAGRERDLDPTAYPWFDLYWAEPERIPFLVLLGDEVSGFCLLRDTGTCWQVAEFFILPPYRRQGVGAAAVHGLKTYCQRDGRYCDLEARTLRSNPGSALFWHKQGFLPVRQEGALLVNVCSLNGPAKEPKPAETTAGGIDKNRWFGRQPRSPVSRQKGPVSRNSKRRSKEEKDMDATPSKLVLLDPTVAPRPEDILLAPRLESLEGISLGLVDNTKDKSDKVLEYIAAILDGEYHFKEIIRARKKAAGMPPAPEMIADMKARAHAIITGIGD